MLNRTFLLRLAAFERLFSHGKSGKELLSYNNSIHSIENFLINLLFSKPPQTLVAQGY